MAPELALALALIAVFAGIVAFAWLWTSAPERQPTVEAEIARLAQQTDWLENRLELADREGWEPELVDQLAGQLAAACAELTKVHR